MELAAAAGPGQAVPPGATGAASRSLRSCLPKGTPERREHGRTAEQDGAAVEPDAERLSPELEVVCDAAQRSRVIANALFARRSASRSRGDIWAARAGWLPRAMAAGRDLRYQNL